MVRLAVEYHVSAPSLASSPRSTTATCGGVLAKQQTPWPLGTLPEAREDRRRFRVPRTVIRCYSRVPPLPPPEPCLRARRVGCRRVLSGSLTHDATFFAHLTTMYCTLCRSIKQWWCCTGTSRSRLEGRVLLSAREHPSCGPAAADARDTAPVVEIPCRTPGVLRIMSIVMNSFWFSAGSADSIRAARQSTSCAARSCTRPTPRLIQGRQVLQRSVDVHD